MPGLSLDTVGHERPGPPPAIDRSGPGSEGRRGSHRRRRWDGPRFAVLIAALLSAAAAAGLSHTVFAHLSVNNDESVYLLQAQAFAAGHLFPVAPHPAASFTPWLGVIHGDHYVLKYTPVVAGFLAVSLVLTGGYVAALACWAAALVGATFLLAKEATGNRTAAAIAAVLLSASPVVLVQSALLLPYVPFLVLVELGLWAVLRGTRKASFWTLVLAGFCVGLAFVARQFDALLLLAPSLCWALLRSPRALPRRAAALVLGAIPPALGLLWWDRAATGSPWHLPFSLFQSGDTLGFGVHRLYPGEAARRFGPHQGWQGLARHLELLGGGWAFGGVLLVALALVGLWRRPPASCVALLAGGLLFTGGYFFFWGIWNAAIVWGAVRYLGPYYLMPLLVSLSILAGLGLERIAASSKRRAGLVIVLAIGLSSAAIVPALRSDIALNAANAQLADAVAARGRSLVFLDTYPSYLQHPTAVVSDGDPVGGRTVYALERGGDDFAALRSFPGRPIYRLSLLGEYGKLPHARYGARLQALNQLSGGTLSLSVSTRLPRAMSGARLVVSVGSRTSTALLAPGTVSSAQISLTSASAVTGAQPGSLAFTSLKPGMARAVTFSVRAPGRRGLGRTIDHFRIPLEIDASGQLRTLVPMGPAQELGPLPAPVISVAQDIP